MGGTVGDGSAVGVKVAVGRAVALSVEVEIVAVAVAVRVKGLVASACAVGIVGPDAAIGFDAQETLRLKLHQARSQKKIARFRLGKGAPNEFR